MQQTTLGTFGADNDDEAGFDMDEYKRELDSIIAPVIPGMTDPLE